MDATLITAVTAVSSTALGMLGTLAAARRQARANTEAARLQSETQLTTIEHQYFAARDADSRRSRQQRLESAYEELSKWLEDLDAAVEKVVELVYSDKPDADKELRTLCDDWPFTVLVPPKSAAFARCFWSTAVDKLLREFNGTSATFVGAATRFRTARGEDETGVDPGEAKDRQRATQDAKSTMWDGRVSLQGITARVRTQIQTEIYARYDGDPAEATPIWSGGTPQI